MSATMASSLKKKQCSGIHQGSKIEVFFIIFYLVEYLTRSLLFLFSVAG